MKKNLLFSIVTLTMIFIASCSNPFFPAAKNRQVTSYITIGGTVDVQINGEDPDKIEIIIKSKDDTVLGKTEADENGNWTVKIPEPEVGTELVIEVIATDKDGNEVRYETIVVVEKDSDGNIVLVVKGDDNDETNPGNINLGTMYVTITGIYEIGEELSVAATGITPLTYQWQRDGEAIAGANNLEYTIQSADAGKVLSCVITYGANGRVTVTGGKALLPVPSDMVLVKAGSFQMGKNLGAGGYTDETNAHMVTLTKDFYMCKYPVTQELYLAVTGNNPSIFSTGADGGEVQGKRPVENVTWYDAIEFCNKLSEDEGLEPVYTIEGRTPASGYPITGATVTPDWSKNGYRLPSEAQWEYAAKGGHIEQAYDFAGSDNVNDVAWYNGNSNNKTHEVMKKAPNALGLYDMSGNVYEWCWDWYEGYSSGAQTDPVGASSGSGRVLRGGSWISSAGVVRSAYRSGNTPSVRSASIGCRLVRP